MLASFFFPIVYKHARIKRDDGDDFAIGDNRGFIPTDSAPHTDLDKRQRARPGSKAVYQCGNADRCGKHARNSDISSSSPSAGGVQTIKSWTDGQEGNFTVIAQLEKWDNLEASYHALRQSDTGCQ